MFYNSGAAVNYMNLSFKLTASVEWARIHTDTSRTQALYVKTQQPTTNSCPQTSPNYYYTGVTGKGQSKTCPLHLLILK